MAREQAQEFRSAIPAKAHDTDIVPG
jgi:hypothetical protein